MLRTLTVAAVLTCVGVADAAAQIVQRPTRPYRGLFGGGPPPDPNRTRSELTFTGSVMAGYDTWLSPGASSFPYDSAEARQSGNTFVGDAALSYFRGRRQRSLSLDGRLQSNAYGGIDTDATLGGTVRLGVLSDLGRATTLRVLQDVGYEPTLVLGSQGQAPLESTAPVAPVPDVTSGYLQQRSWSSHSFFSLDRRWTTRHTTGVAGAYSRQIYLDDLGNDTRTRVANAMHSWLFSRSASIRGRYSLSDSDFQSAGGLITPMTSQGIELSIGLNRRLSPTRQLQITAGGGATHVNTLNVLDRSDLSYWMPSGNGSISWDVGRSWSIAGSYDRSVSVLHGVSLTSFATDSASTSFTGLIGSRIEASVSTAYANGRSGGLDTTGRFENYSGSLQLLFALSRCCATTVNYDYYVYRFEDVTDLPNLFPPDFDRQAIRFGFTLRLPLYGTYVDGGPSRGSRRN
jgi:hypothetical protein